jgi:hypothetical protein
MKLYRSKSRFQYGAYLTDYENNITGRHAVNSFGFKAVSATFLASLDDHQDQPKKPTPRNRFIFEKLTGALVLWKFCAFLFLIV